MILMARNSDTARPDLAPFAKADILTPVTIVQLRIQANTCACVCKRSCSKKALWLSLIDGPSAYHHSQIEPFKRHSARVHRAEKAYIIRVDVKWNYNSSQRVHLLIQVAKSPRLSVQTPPVQLSFGAHRKKDLASRACSPKCAVIRPACEHIIYVNDPGCRVMLWHWTNKRSRLTRGQLRPPSWNLCTSLSQSARQIVIDVSKFTQRPFVRQFFINVKVHRLPSWVALLLLCNRLGNSSRAGHQLQLTVSVHVIFLWSQFLSQLRIKLIQSLHYFSAWDASCEISCCLTTWLGLEATATLHCFKPFANSRKFISL